MQLNSKLGWYWLRVRSRRQIEQRYTTQTIWCVAPKIQIYQWRRREKVFKYIKVIIRIGIQWWKSQFLFNSIDISLYRQNEEKISIYKCVLSMGKSRYVWCRTLTSYDIMFLAGIMVTSSCKRNVTQVTWAGMLL